jgi:branched-chain amino acid transport system substrate-binding protein
MKTRGLTFICISIILVSFLWTLPIGAADPIKFGFLQTLSGGVAQQYGIDDLDGVKIAIEEINAKGGILGRPLEAIVRDDKLAPEPAVRGAKDLILNEKVNWIQGGVSSAVALAVSSLCRKEKVPYIITGAMSSKITTEEGHRYVFRMTTNTDLYAVTMANAVVRFWPGLKKVFTISPDYEYGHITARDFMAAYKKLVPDATLVGQLWPKLGHIDFTAHVTTILNSGCDLVYASIFAGDALSFIKAATPFGYFDKMKTVGQDWGIHETLRTMTKEMYCKGVIAATPYPFYMLDIPLSKTFVSTFTKKTGRYPGFYAASGYSIVYAMKKAIEKAGSVNIEKAIDALAGSTIDTAVGPVLIRACDHQAMWPYYAGIVDATDEYPWPRLTKIFSIDPASKGYTRCEEVLSRRKK